MSAGSSIESGRDRAERELKHAAAYAQFVAGVFVLAAAGCAIRALVIFADARGGALLAYVGGAFGCLSTAVAFNLAAKAAVCWIARRDD